jgi:hypothetical protein
MKFTTKLGLVIEAIGLVILSYGFWIKINYVQNFPLILSGPLYVTQPAIKDPSGGFIALGLFFVGIGMIVLIMQVSEMIE